MFLLLRKNTIMEICRNCIIIFLCSATVLLDYATFWVGITSTPVQVNSAKGGPSSVAGPTELGRSENV